MCIFGIEDIKENEIIVDTKNNGCGKKELFFRNRQISS